MKKDKLYSDKTVIEKFITEITKNWLKNVSDKECFEIRCIKENQSIIFQRFSTKEIGLAVDFVFKKNEDHFNTYMTINPINSMPKIANAAKDENIELAHFCFADADDQAGLDGLQKLSFKKSPNIIVTTGNIPHKREHYYWRLNTPCTDMDLWRIYQKRLAKTCRTDISISNPSRIMRIPGCISFPNKKKTQKGYIPEIVLLKLEPFNDFE